MSNKFLDKDIYKKAKKVTDEKYKKNSAYKSMFLVEEYERLGGKINKNLKKSGTANWLKEKWINLTPIAMGLETDIKKLPVRLTHFSDLQVFNLDLVLSFGLILPPTFSKKQIIKALKIKKQNKRINWNDL